MIYNNYKIMMIHKGDKNFYSTECIGTTVAEAIDTTIFGARKVTEFLRILKSSRQ